MKPLEQEIINTIQHLNGRQQGVLLDYIKTFKPQRHSKRRYRTKAMRQIRQALENI